MSDFDSKVIAVIYDTLLWFVDWKQSIEKFYSIVHREVVILI
jgi:hypothetical protein